MQRIAIVILFLGAYACAILYPFDWRSPHPLPNNARYAADGGLVFPIGGQGVAKSPAAPGWLSSAIGSHRLDVSLRARPFSGAQFGPARLVTLSENQSRRNFMIGQKGANLIVRVRTAWTTGNGVPNYVIEDVFATDAWVDIDVAIRPGMLRVTAAGKRARFALPPDPMALWEPHHRLALGNEVSHNRPWVGELARAEIGTKGARVDYARPGTLAIPEQLRPYRPNLRLVPLRDLGRRDGISNFFGFIPLGALAGALIAGFPAAPIVAIAAVGGYSLALEILQIWVPSRFSSINDVILNTLGGAAGVLILLAIRRRRTKAAAIP